MGAPSGIPPDSPGDRSGDSSVDVHLGFTLGFSVVSSVVVPGVVHVAFPRRALMGFVVFIALCSFSVIQSSFSRLPSFTVFMFLPSTFALHVYLLHSSLIFFIPHSTFVLFVHRPSPRFHLSTLFPAIAPFPNIDCLHFISLYIGGLCFAHVIQKNCEAS